MSLYAIAVALGLPPLSLLLIALVALFQLKRAPRVSAVIIGTCLIAMLVLAIPAVANFLLAELERQVPSGPASATPPAAIIILSGDHHIGATDAERIALGPLTLERLRAGAALARATNLPILVTGGHVTSDTAALGSLMARDLDQDFRVPVRWTEDEARDTWENAALSAAILHRAGINSAYLVTHGWHMPRALVAFRHFGITATPAPTALTATFTSLADSILPEATAWSKSYYALHEWVGLLWYSMRDKINRKEHLEGLVGHEISIVK